MGIVERLIYARTWPVLGRFVHELLLIYGIDIAKTVRIGEGLLVEHRGHGIVIYPTVELGNRVHLFHQVTIGRVDPHVPLADPSMQPVVIEDDVMICTGAKVLGGVKTTRVGRGTVVGANAVLTQSTGEYEVWAGIPARKVGDRDPADVAAMRSHYFGG